MTKLATPLILLALLCAAFAGLLAWSAPQLPERVATHFAINGYPDRWTTRTSAIALIGGFGLGLPLLTVALALAVRLMPSSTINIPNREYWLAPERRAATYGFFTRQLLWLACLIVSLMTALHWLSFQANLSTPVRMPTRAFLTILGLFLGGMAVWVINFLRRFRKPV